MPGRTGRQQRDGVFNAYGDSLSKTETILNLPGNSKLQLKTLSRSKQL